MNPITFEVIGDPKGQPRARSFVVRGKGGKPILDKKGNPIVRVNDPSTAEGWKSAVAQTAKDFVPMPPMQGPLRVDIEFRFSRPKYHFRSNGELKASAPTWHTGKPDRDNCEKAVSDALKVLGMFSDDSQICAGEVTKVYIPRHPRIVRNVDDDVAAFVETQERPGALIKITPLEDLKPSHKNPREMELAGI